MRLKYFFIIAAFLLIAFGSFYSVHAGWLDKIIKEVEKTAKEANEPTEKPKEQPKKEVGKTAKEANEPTEKPKERTKPVTKDTFYNFIDGHQTYGFIDNNNIGNINHKWKTKRKVIQKDIETALNKLELVENFHCGITIYGYRAKHSLYFLHDIFYGFSISYSGTPEEVMKLKFIRSFEKVLGPGKRDKVRNVIMQWENDEVIIKLHENDDPNAYVGDDSYIEAFYKPYLCKARKAQSQSKIELEKEKERQVAQLQNKEGWKYLKWGMSKHIMFMLLKENGIDGFEIKKLYEWLRVNDKLTLNEEDIKTLLKIHHPIDLYDSNNLRLFFYKGILFGVQSNYCNSNITQADVFKLLKSKYPSGVIKKLRYSTEFRATTKQSYICADTYCVYFHDKKTIDMFFKDVRGQHEKKKKQKLKSLM